MLPLFGKSKGEAFMIERKDLFYVPFYNKTVYTGSYHGMHYKLEKIKQEDKSILRATTWPGPLCFDMTEASVKEYHDFAFSDDGISVACDWLNGQYIKHEDLWKTVHI